MTRSLILSGGGAYADPWHPFAATSARIAGILTALGHEVEICDHVADRVADLRGWDLIAVNGVSQRVSWKPNARAEGPRRSGEETDHLPHSSQ